MKLGTLAKYSVILTILPAIYVLVFPSKIVLITIFCSYPLLILLIHRATQIDLRNLDSKFILCLFLFYSLSIFLRGLLSAQSYQDWTTLATVGPQVFIFLPLAILYGIYTSAIKQAFLAFLTIGFLCVFLLLSDDLRTMDFGHSTSPIYLLLIFSPYLTKRARYIVYVVAFVSFFSDITVRSNMINITIAVLISFTFTLKESISGSFLIRFFWGFFLITPIIFIILGASGIFNVFQIGNLLGEYTIEGSKEKSQDLLVDSRTSIYTDVLFQLNKDDALFFGLGGNGKTKTSLSDISYADYDVIYKEGRRGTESGMLNYFQWGGIVGAFLYFLLFIHSSFLAIYRSNNWLCKMVGTWVAFKGFFSFIEDRLEFNIYSLFVFIAIGICLNSDLRSMSERQVRSFLFSLFNNNMKRKLIFKSSWKN